jgi:hypothetical protein
MVQDRLLTGVEFRDAMGLGFHKIILTDESELGFSQCVMRAFEQDPLTDSDVGNAIKANHLDGACCPACEAKMRSATRDQVAALKDFIQRAMTLKAPLGAMLFHPGLVTLRRFVPEQWNEQGLWTGVTGGYTRLFFRSSGFGSVRFSRLDPEDTGPHDIAAIRNADGDLLATLIIEDLPQTPA